ncbi:MAG: AAA family ATPase [Fusobacteriaceae bacterium]|jgi:AAA+ superfamily predicted ATPase|nr:AAA family ATPase [Fusobacteriaceae bacterium]
MKRTTRGNKKKTEYAYLDVTYDNTEVVDFDLIANRVEQYNGTNYIHFYSSEFLTDNNGSTKTILRFIWIYAFSDDEYLTEEFDEISDMLETQVNMTVIKPLEMNPIELKKLKLAKQLKEIETPRYGLRKTTQVRWNIKNEKTIIDQIGQLQGFEDFKMAIKKLKTYCDIIQTKNIKGKYNIAFVNNSGMDSEMFINHIYDLYAAKGILNDFLLVKGNLGDAVDFERNSSFLFHIDESIISGNWKSNFLSVPRESKSFTKLSERNTIYIMDMNKEQYENLSLLENFQMMFPHVITIDKLTPEEKLIHLQLEAQKYHFKLDNASFLESNILSSSFDFLYGQLISTANHLIANNESRDTLTAADFIIKSVSPEEGDPYEDLNNMIGLEEVKKKINEIVHFLKNRGKDAVPCLHMVFCGNPGTGKTTVARIIGKIFGKEGVIPKKDLFVETAREGLVGLYVGHTAHKTVEKIRTALGGVLFIDEAYSLGIYGSGHDYGQEALSTLVKQMEDHRKDFVCIMAGYTDEMNKMLDINPGLRDRVQFYIDFPDYDADELFRIFMGICKHEKYQLTAKAEVELKSYLEKIIQNKDIHFSNARLVRKIYERVAMKQAMRTTGDLISEEDIHECFMEHDIKNFLYGKKVKNRIGFAV